jgi:hypothetical protein
MTELTSLIISTPGRDDLSYFLYIWLVPLMIGLPGNILYVIIANRKHNRHLSPCIYMTAMGVVDTVFVLERIGLITLIQGYLLEHTEIDHSWYFR